MSDNNYEYFSIQAKVGGATMHLSYRVNKTDFKDIELKLGDHYVCSEDIKQVRESPEYKETIRRIKIRNYKNNER
jgi:hypothetical protein